MQKKEDMSNSFGTALAIPIAIAFSNSWKTLLAISIAIAIAIVGKSP